MYTLYVGILLFTELYSVRAGKHHDTSFSAYSLNCPNCVTFGNTYLSLLCYQQIQAFNRICTPLRMNEHAEPECWFEPPNRKRSLFRQEVVRNVVEFVGR